MSKTWIVFTHEYIRHVWTRRFLFGLLSLPLTLILAAIVSFAGVWFTTDFRPVAVIDQSGYFPDTQPFKDREGPLAVQVIPYADEESARQALDQGNIQAYFVIQPDYLTTGKVRSVSQTGVDTTATNAVSQYLLTHLLENEDPRVKNRILEGPDLMIETLNGKETSKSTPPWTPMLIFAFGMIFFFSISITGNYILKALGDEKENRTMEIILSSISTNQFITGKLFGNLSVGLTQLLFWFPAPVAILLFSLRNLPALGTFSIDLDALWLMILLAVPAFIMIAALMTMVGAIVAEGREAQQFSGLFGFPFYISLFFMETLLEKPDSPLSIGLSLFPFSAPISLPLRSVATSIPFWQIALSEGILILCAGFSIWLAGRAFRLGMLRYGKKVTLKELFRSPAS